MLKKNVYKPKYKSLLYFKDGHFFNKEKILKFKKQKWLKSVLVKKAKTKIEANNWLKLVLLKKIKKKKNSSFF